MNVKVRSLYHTPKGERGIGKWIVGWTWVLAAVYSVPHIFKKPPVGSSRWKEYIKALCYNFSHEEIWIASHCGAFIAPDENNKTKYLGQCFSSTTRGLDDGVRFAPASEVLKHPKRWMYIEWECDQYDFDYAMVRARKRIGRKYDFRGVSGFVNPLPYIGRAAAKLLRMDKAAKWCENKMQNPNKDYCSELGNLFKYWCGIWDVILLVVSPRRSAYLLAKKTGREPKPLVGE